MYTFYCPPLPPYKPLRDESILCKSVLGMYVLGILFPSIFSEEFLLQIIFYRRRAASRFQFHEFLITVSSQRKTN